jgi:hypothetical protein
LIAATASAAAASIPQASTGIVMRSARSRSMNARTSKPTSIIARLARLRRACSTPASGLRTMSTSTPASRAISAASVKALPSAPISSIRIAGRGSSCISDPAARFQ